MTIDANLLSEEFGSRVGWWLRSFYPGARAKNVAREFGVSEATARRWLAGERPTSDIVVAMGRRFGWRFVNFIYEPVIGTPAIRAEMDALDARLARLEEERDQDDAAGALAIARVAPAPGDISRRVAGTDAPPPCEVEPAAQRRAGR